MPSAWPCWRVYLFIILWVIFPEPRSPTRNIYAFLLTNLFLILLLRIFPFHHHAPTTRCLHGELRIHHWHRPWCSLFKMTLTLATSSPLWVVVWIVSPQRHQRAARILIYDRVRYSILVKILFPKAVPGISPPSMHSALIDIGLSHLSSGSLVTEAVETPLDFPRQTTIAAKSALENTQSSWGSFVTTHEINTPRPNPSPPIPLISYQTRPVFPPPDTPLPPTDGFPPPLDIVPESEPLIRHRHSPPRPVVCEKHFERRPEDASYHRRMVRARANSELREPAKLKKTFCRRNKGTCPTHHSSTCFTIHVGPSRSQCRTESVALRDIQKVLGLCWTCNTW